MKNIIIILLICFLHHSLNGQNSFTLVIRDEMLKIPHELIELSDHSYLLSSSDRTDMANMKQRFFRITPQGTISRDTIIVNPAGACALLNLEYFNDTNIVSLGLWQKPGDKIEFWITGIDSALNFKWEKRYKTMFEILGNSRSTATSQGKIILACTMMTNNPEPYYLEFFSFSATGDSLHCRVDSLTSHNMIFDIEEIPTPGKYKVAGFKFTDTINYGGQLLTLDTLLRTISIDSIPKHVWNCTTIKPCNPSKYYLTGNLTITTTADRPIASMLLDSLNDCSIFASFGKHYDTINYGGLDQSMDIYDPNIVYVAGTSNINLQNPYYSAYKSWYCLSSYDSLLNLRWTKYYGGDVYYLLRSVVATRDGGAILTGTRYNYQTQDQELDIYIIKVDTSGVITSVDNSQDKIAHDAIVFPNPGNDILTVQSGPQIQGALFTLFDLKGKQIITRVLSSDKIQVSTSQLPPGIYPWQITRNGKTAEYGKWIRQ